MTTDPCIRARSAVPVLLAAISLGAGAAATGTTAVLQAREEGGEYPECSSAGSSN